MNRIKELRENEKISQKEFAQKFNVQQNTVSSWERNNSEPNIDLLIKIADYFNVSVDYLIGRANELNQVIVIEELSQNEKYFIGILRQLNERMQARLIGYAAGLVEQQNA